MVNISISAFIAAIVVISYIMIFTRNHDILMVRACRCYAYSKLKSDAILEYVASAWKVFPYLVSMVAVCTYVIVYSLLKSI